MKTILQTISLISFFLIGAVKISAQTFCHANGNVIVYSNYDGGFLNINIDQNIPNLKVGITTYEKCQVTFSGAYVSNITQVIYAGYNANNNHCSPSPVTTAVSGVSSSIVSILLYPAATWSNNSGNGSIICNYDCDSITNQGGCNTPDQIVHYYITQFGGSLYYHFTQYGCWTTTKNVSAGGNCCIGANIIPPTSYIVAGFTSVNDTLCDKDTLQFTNTSFNTYSGATLYNWNFGDGTSIDTNANPLHVFNNPGTYTVTLIAGNATGTDADTFQMDLVMIDCTTGMAEYGKNNFVSIYPNPAKEKINCSFKSYENADAKISLQDISGREMKNISVRILRGENNFALDVDKISEGIYFFNIFSDIFSFHKKIVISNRKL